MNWELVKHIVIALLIYEWGIKIFATVIVGLFKSHFKKDIEIKEKTKTFQERLSEMMDKEKAPN